MMLDIRQRLQSNSQRNGYIYLPSTKIDLLFKFSKRAIRTFLNNNSINVRDQIMFFI